ncbi:MAG: shikimate kinase [Actinomycetia bacterium]|nr:shikimate kinase [Actinomycetes bacterium]
MTPRIILVGPPGAGKTTVGDEIAALLGLAVRDTDADIERAQGQPIADIFVDHGERHFREAEVSAVRAALDEHDGIVSLGGGAVLHEATRAALRGHNVVFLDVGLSEAARRVGLNTARPLLLGNVRSQMKALMDQRRAIYLDVAECVVQTDSRSPREVADEIVAWLSEGERAR